MNEILIRIRLRMKLVLIFLNHIQTAKRAKTENERI